MCECNDGGGGYWAAAAQVSLGIPVRACVYVRQLSPCACMDVCVYVCAFLRRSGRYNTPTPAGDTRYALNPTTTAELKSKPLPPAELEEARDTPKLSYTFLPPSLYLSLFPLPPSLPKQNTPLVGIST